MTIITLIWQFLSLGHPLLPPTPKNPRITKGMIIKQLDSNHEIWHQPK